MVRKLRSDRETVERGGHGVNRQLPRFGNCPDVFWSKGYNSFVCVRKEDGELRIYSINGIGEIRWAVEDWNNDEESNAARAYFFEE